MPDYNLKTIALNVDTIKNSGLQNFVKYVNTAKYVNIAT